MKDNIRGYDVGVTRRCEVISGSDSVQLLNVFHSMEEAWDYAEMIEDLDLVLKKLQGLHEQGVLRFLDQDNDIIEPDDFGYNLDGELLLDGTTDSQQKRALTTIIFSGCGAELEEMFFAILMPHFDYMEVDISKHERGVITADCFNPKRLSWIDNLNVVDEMVADFLPTFNSENPD